jgi:hypothetical protein
VTSVMIEPMDEKPVRGNLKAHLRGNKLLLPRELVDALRRDGVRTAEDLMSYIDSFPSSVARTLHWSVGDVNNAKAVLRTQLVGQIADDHLRPQRRPNPTLGARDPDDLP